MNDLVKYAFPVKIEREMSGKKEYEVRLQGHKDHISFKCQSDHEAETLVRVLNFGRVEVTLRR